MDKLREASASYSTKQELACHLLHYSLASAFPAYWGNFSLTSSSSTVLSHPRLKLAQVNMRLHQYFSGWFMKFLDSYQICTCCLVIYFNVVNVGSVLVLMKPAMAGIKRCSDASPCFFFKSSWRLSDFSWISIKLSRTGDWCWPCIYALKSFSISSVTSPSFFYIIVNIIGTADFTCSMIVSLFFRILPVVDWFML